MTDTKVPCIVFNQFDAPSRTDDLILFAAPAKVLANWAGIPRKGWRIRMLFQRPLSDVRSRQIADFWRSASSPGPGEDFILGPNAITVAIQGAPTIRSGMIDLSYKPIIDFQAKESSNLQTLATLIFPGVNARLTDEQTQELKELASDPFGARPDINHDYVFEFALQLTQMTADPERFISENQIPPDELAELIVAMESICRPAIVVDGQHRLHGAAAIDNIIRIPVVAIPNCSWARQVYQFVVINEKAQRVDSTILTDIFGSSLTKKEQAELRATLKRARVEIEARIISVIANREPHSPFYQMIKLNIDGAT
jgi:hypothetical protein